MEHFQSYSPRKVLQLPNAELGGWQLKRYAVLAHDRVFDSAIASSALESAVTRLPRAGKLANSDGNHGVGFQIIHFAEIAVVSPVFYWIWGTVLANTHQMRAQWEEPTTFETGVKEVVGCVWEMEIVCFVATCNVVCQWPNQYHKSVYSASVAWHNGPKITHAI